MDEEGGSLPERYDPTPLAGRPPAADRASGVPAPASDVPGGAWFQALVEAAPDAIVGVDGQGFILFVNGRAESLFGYGRDEVVGQPLDMLIPERFRASHNRHHATYMQEPKPRPMGTPLKLFARRKDDSEFAADISLSFVEGPGGLVYLSFIRDITDLLEAQKAQFFLASIVESSQDAIVGATPEGTILSWNGGAERLCGYSAQEAEGRSIALILPPDRAEELQGYAASALKGKGVEGLETVLRRKDGSLVNVALTFSPLRDRKGDVAGTSMIAIDITERKLAETALKESEERYRRIVETTQDGVWVADAAGRTTFVNARVQELLGYTAAEMMGAPLEGFVPKEDRPLLASHLERRRKGLREQYDLRLRRKDGGDLWVIVSAAPLASAGGEYAGTFAMITDITARKKAEADLARSNTDLEAFSFSVSHDLRAPLRSLQGFSKALLEDYSGVLDITGKDYALRIAAAADRMDVMVSDLLDYSRLTRAKLELGTVDLESEVRHVLSQMAEDLRKREATVNVKWPLPEAMGERQALRRILSNLISNASKFVAPGVKPSVLLWVEPRDGWVRVWVEDNGIGIAPDDQERIWRVFERLHGDDTYAGTGIGLSIVRRGAEGMGGRAGVESSPGQGSRFWVELRPVG